MRDSPAGTFYTRARYRKGTDRSSLLVPICQARGVEIQWHGEKASGKPATPVLLLVRGLGPKATTASHDRPVGMGLPHDLEG